MEFLKNLIIDSFNGFSPKLIPLFILQLLVAGFLAYLLQKVVNRKFDKEIITHAVIIAVGIALIAAISKYALPLAVLSSSAIIILGLRQQTDKNDLLGLFLTVVIGIGCGSGYLVLTCLGLIVLLPIIFLLPIKK